MTIVDLLLTAKKVLLSLGVGVTIFSSVVGIALLLGKLIWLGADSDLGEEILFGSFAFVLLLFAGFLGAGVLGYSPPPPPGF